VLVVLDGALADERLRGPDVAQAVSRVAALPELRQWAHTRFREAVDRSQSMVVDGRDIGTAVYPEAPLKIFLTATPEARASRRLLQGGATRTAAQIAEEAARLAARDHADSTRAVAPLRRAPDAVVVDTTTLTLAEQIEQILTLARRIWLP
jgi:cytidylate kinase